MIATPPTRYYFATLLRLKLFLKVFMCYILSVYEKKIEVCFASFNGLLLSILYK